MGIQRALYRIGSTFAIFAVAAACSSSGVSPAASGSCAANGAPSASAKACLSAPASPTASATVAAKPTDTPWATAKVTAVPSESQTEAPTDSTIATPAPAPDGWNIYTDSTAGIRFAYPPAWAPTTTSGYSAVATSDNGNLVLWMTQAAGGMTLDGYKPIDLASMDVEPDNQGEVGIGGVAGWGAEWHVTKSGKALYVLDCFTVRSDKTFDFMWMSSPGNEDADITLFQQIESTLVFTK
jgi:hypothetical protein